MTNKEYTNLVEQGKFPEDPRVPLDKGFEDARGVIQNLLLTSIRNIAVITSKAGSIRSNHYHKEDWHYMYVVSGSMNYWERDVSASGEGIEPIVIKAGELVFTGPNKV